MPGKESTGLERWTQLVIWGMLVVLSSSLIGFRYHHCANSSKYCMAHLVFELICASQFRQGHRAIDMVSPRRNRIVGTHDRLGIISLEST